MSGASFETIVSQYYEPLYRFAFSLTRAEADASDLTQHTFYVWATKGDQLRDASRIKSWLFTTLHRAFLQSRRRDQRFPHQSLHETEDDLLFTEPVMADHADCERVLAALRHVDENYQAAVALFYLEDCSYKEIADILDVPVGTVKSRLARGLGQLKKLLVTTGHVGRLGKAPHE